MAGRGGIRKNVGQGRFNSGTTPVTKGSPLKKGDARLKIIQKNRSKLVDARDKLAQMAKKTDARAKLLKLRQMRSGITNLSTDIVQPVGKSILKKTDRNGKISLSTNKTAKVQPSPVDIHMAIRKELGLVSNNKKNINRSPQAKARLRNNRANAYTNTLRKPVAVNQNAPVFRRTLEMDTVYARPPPVIQRTIRNDIVPAEMPYSPVESGLRSWGFPEAYAPQPLKFGIKNAMPTVDLTRDMDWVNNDATNKHMSVKLPTYFADYDYDDMGQTRVCRVKTGIYARLDTPSASSQSQGIFAQANKPKVVVPVGHRIVVSNLQPTVTQDDIRELFEDVGELLVSRLVRPGTAEVIYKSLRDAQKAVDTYHNRQLDGQPMKCLLVNKRPINNPTAPALRSDKTGPSVLRSNGGITKKIVASPSKNVNKLVPDISTIHKVLFHKT